MIVIFSNKRDFQTTSRVLDWLDYFEVPYKVIYGSNYYQINYIDFKSYDDFEFQFSDQQGKLISSLEVEYFWYRRGMINFKKPELSNESIKSIIRLTDELFYQKISGHLYDEYKLISNFMQLLIQLRSLNSPLNNNINKLEVLLKASQYGLGVPRTFISDCQILQKKLLDNTANKFISKNFTQGVFIEGAGIQVSGLTTIPVANKHVQYTDDMNGQYSVFQEYINKEIDLRIIHVNNKLFSFAILSQEDKKTQIDFRNYNSSNPNSIIQIAIPKEIESKLRLLLNHYKLDYAAIDMVYDNKTERYFLLEINPIGQFLQFSLMYNVNIEKEIGEYLKLKYEERKRN